MAWTRWKLSQATHYLRSNSKDNPGGRTSGLESRSCFGGTLSISSKLFNTDAGQREEGNSIRWEKMVGEIAKKNDTEDKFSLVDPGKGNMDQTFEDEFSKDV